VGLGNPGRQYRDTRHNVGFRVIDEVARRAGETCDREKFGALIAKTPGALLAKPLTFMNLSGQAVQALLDFYQVEVHDLLIVADEVHLPLGRLRARRGGSAGGHNGFKSVAQHLGTNEFPRLRVGVGRGDQARDLSGHVLGRFDTDETVTMEEAITRAADAVEAFVSDGIDVVMRRYNADPAKAGQQKLPADDSGNEKDSQS
jgi:PTH1 family peptidyl-tRNA hydrolase